MKRLCLALDLKDSPSAISQYEEWHRKVWPEITKSIRDAGIDSMEIYRTGNRLFMIMETRDDFDLAAKAAMDESNPKVREWEALMGTYQQALPWSRPGEKWVLMNKIFELPEDGEN